MTRASRARALGLVVSLGVATTAHAGFTCSSVARRGDVDPAGEVFSNRFDEKVAVSPSGDVLFIGSAGGQRQALYRYRNVGPNGIIARDGDPAPGGSAFGNFAGSRFGRLSINSAGNAAFIARLALPGEGVFVDVGGALEKAARTTDLSPSGGFFVSFPSVSAINDANEVAFIGLTDIGPSGIFRYDADTNLLVTVVDTTATDTLGRPFCSFGEVGLSDAGLAFTATVGVPNCLTPIQGVFTASIAGFPAVTLAGDPSPIGGTTFTSFVRAPETGASITFEATVSGLTYTGSGIFSSAAPATIVAAGDAAPSVGGTVKKLGGQHRQTLAGNVATRLFLRSTTAKQGIFLYDGSPEAGVVKTDTPPVPPFGPSSRYRTIGPPAVDETGAFFAFRAKMLDTVAPGSKTGVLRCTP